MLEPTAIDSARSMRFRIAMRIAVDCSAELPITATTITPTNTSLMPKTCATCSTEPTRISLTHAISAVTTASTARHLVTLQLVSPPSSSAAASAGCPAKSCL